MTSTLDRLHLRCLENAGSKRVTVLVQHSNSLSSSSSTLTT